MTRKILIVDDETPIRALLLEILGNQDHYVLFSARDGAEALQIARTESPDAILLDVWLPKIEGYQVCQTIKSDPNLSHTKVLMLSSLAQKSDRQKAERAGADDYLIKPFSSTALLEKVDKLLRSGV